MYAAEKHKKIGLNILYYRRLRGYSQEELADRVGMSRPRLSAIERGNVTLTLETMLKLAKELEVDIVNLITRNE